MSSVSITSPFKIRVRNAFCLELKASSLTKLFLFDVAMTPEQEVQVASTVARSNTLVDFQLDQSAGTTSSFWDHYYAQLLNNVDSKLEWLSWDLGRECKIRLYGDGGTARGVDAAVVANLRLFLGLNIQRRTHGPLFAAIGDARTNAARKQCLVEAFLAGTCPLLFEYIRSNQYNMIALIQQLGRHATVRMGTPEALVSASKKRRTREKDESEEDDDDDEEEYQTGGFHCEEDAVVVPPKKKSN